jgi:hypothetical protein
MSQKVTMQFNTIINSIFSSTFSHFEFTLMQVKTRGRENASGKRQGKHCACMFGIGKKTEGGWKTDSK